MASQVVAFLIDCHTIPLTCSIEHASGQGPGSTFTYQNSYLKIQILFHTNKNKHLHSAVYIGS